MDEGQVSAEIYTGVWTDVGTPERLTQLILTRRANTLLTPISWGVDGRHVLVCLQVSQPGRTKRLRPTKGRPATQLDRSE